MNWELRGRIVLSSCRFALSSLLIRMNFEFLGNWEYIHDVDFNLVRILNEIIICKNTVETTHFKNTSKLF